MPRNLDDFELERTPYTPKDASEPTATEKPTAHEDTPEPTRYVIDDDTETAPALTAPTPKAGARTFPIALAVLALVSLAVLAAVYFVFRPSPRRSATTTAAPLPTPQPRATAPGEPVEPEAATTLPPLAESDAFVRQQARAVSSDPEIARWLAQRSLVPTLAAVVTNVVDGESPRPHLGFLAPKQHFRVKGGRNGRIVPDPASFAGYDRFADAVASIDASRLAAEYRRLEPLFDAAYRELGHPEAGFSRAVDRAIAALVAVPVLDADVALVPHAIGFRYADPRLEALTAAQKQFLRIGPRNVQKVQGKLRELRAALGAAEATQGAASR